MAKDTPVTEPEWEEVSVGIGEEWDFDKRGDLIGKFIATRMVPIPEAKQYTKNGELVKEAQIWEFVDENGEVYFLWDSYKLAEGLKDAGAGSMVKIQFQGYKKFDGSDGPRQIKEFKIFLAK